MPWDIDTYLEIESLSGWAGGRGTTSALLADGDSLYQHYQQRLADQRDAYLSSEEHRALRCAQVAEARRRERQRQASPGVRAARALARRRKQNVRRCRLYRRRRRLATQGRVVA